MAHYVSVERLFSLMQPQILRGTLPPTSPRGYGPAKETRAIHETR